MKKFISMLICVSVVATFASCGAGVQNNNAKTIQQESSTTNAAASTQKKSNATYTGYKPLPEIKLTVTDSNNSKKLPTEKIEHAYGIASNSKPHQISIDSEKFFETKGYKAVTYNTKTKDKTIYLTFDCGYENGYTEIILDVLKKKNVKAAFFCTLDDIKSEPELIARIIKEGHIVGNHSSTHASFPSLTRTQMAEEIQTCDNYLRTNFGYTSKFFRFPKGDYSESALDLVGSLGFVSVFWSLSYADWDTTDQKGGNYAFEKVTTRLHPGAIILLHSVSSDNAEALERIITYAESQNYKFGTLDKIQSIL